MFRTRDFILLFSVAAFLVGAIGVNYINSITRHSTIPLPTEPADLNSYTTLNTPTLKASTPTVDEQVVRTERVNHLRQKLANQDLTPTTDITGTTTNTDETVNTAEDKALVCENYKPYEDFWDARNISVIAREGAILLTQTIGTTSATILQLPAKHSPASNPHCLTSDVIGIANDGSLIRNDELSLYGIFTNETRVGYALDGLPIYGTGKERGDICGGRLVGGQYRYELSSDRLEIIKCFAATPIELP